MESRGKRILSMCKKDLEYENDSDSDSIHSLPKEFQDLSNELSSYDEYVPSEVESSDSDTPLGLLKNKNSTIAAEGETKATNYAVNCVRQTKKQKKARKSVKGKTRAAKLDRKHKRNHGEEYITESGKVKKARLCQPLSTYRMKCRERFKDEDRETIFKEYWGSGSYEKRVHFITSLVKKGKKASSKRKKTTGKHKNREFTLTYHLRINGVGHKICKQCFRRTLGETNKFLELCSLKMSSNCSGIYESDLRGKQPPKNKYTDDDIRKVTDYIFKIPLYQSHYSRRDTNKKYLPPHYTISKVFYQYLNEPDHIDISRTKFEDIFHTLNIGIKRPSKDTCGKCDELRMKMNLASGEEKDELQKELEIHLKEADDYYNLKSQDKQVSRNDVSKKTVTFDLQQCLPTPQLSTGITFYLRQLWTFNLTIHDCDDNQAYCYMWHEAIASRGANQIGSCLYQFLKDLPDCIQEITLYSDCCAGQNKNSHIIAMYFSILKSHPTLEVIHHKFLVSGHTHHQYKFFDFAKLLKSELQVKKRDEAGNPFNWRDIREIKVEKKNIGIMYFKTSINDNFRSVSFRKRGALPNLVPDSQYKGTVSISAQQKANLMQLLPYISDVFWEFYKNLPTNSDEEAHPDLVSSDDDN